MSFAFTISALVSEQLSQFISFNAPAHSLVGAFILKFDLYIARN